MAHPSQASLQELEPKPAVGRQQARSGLQELARCLIFKSAQNLPAHKVRGVAVQYVWGQGGIECLRQHFGRLLHQALEGESG